MKKLLIALMLLFCCTSASAMQIGEAQICPNCYMPREMVGLWCALPDGHTADYYQKNGKCKETDETGWLRIDYDKITSHWADYPDATFCRVLFATPDVLPNGKKTDTYQVKMWCTGEGEDVILLQRMRIAGEKLGVKFDNYQKISK